MTSAGSALRTRELSKSFVKGFWGSHVMVLDRVTLDVPEGEVLGLLGPNGAGKTTMMRIVLGLIHPSSGEGWIFNRPLSEWDVRKRVGFLPETPYLHDHLTADACLTFFGQLCGLSGVYLKRRAGELLELVGLQEARHRRLRAFSKGMLQRIGIAQALINNPALLLLDEPMSGLDPIGRKEMRGLLFRLKQAGKTIVMSSHLLQDVELLCDRVAILNRGRVAAVVDISDLHRGEPGGAFPSGPEWPGHERNGASQLSLEELYFRAVHEWEGHSA